MKKYGFVYIWRDRKHNRYYIGCHWGTENDGYVCSSNWMYNTWKRRKEDFKRRILITNINSLNETLEEEHKWISLIKEEELGKRYYNLHNHHFGHWTTDTIKKGTIADKISQSHKSNPEWGKWNIGIERSKETREKLRQKNLGKVMSIENSEKKREAMKEVWANGKFTISETTYDKNRNKTEETRKKISENSKRLQAEGRIGMNGKIHSDNTKIKMSKSQKECKKGVKWWTDGYINRQCKEQPGPNFYHGRVLK